MDIEVFQKSFKNNEIDLKPYLLVVSIFIGILVSIIIFNNNIEDYYVNKGIVKDKELTLFVDINDIDKVTNNKKIIIERDIFTYEVTKISDKLMNNDIYKEVKIKVDKLDKKHLLDNNVVDLKVIINKTSILEYLLNTMKGEWHIKKLSNEELKEMNGGGLSLLGIGGIIGAGIFLVGVIDGLFRLKWQEHKNIVSTGNSKEKLFIQMSREDAIMFIK